MHKSDTYKGFCGSDISFFIPRILYIYIYIYMCVYVCVCACARACVLGLDLKIPLTWHMNYVGGMTGNAPVA